MVVLLTLLGMGSVRQVVKVLYRKNLYKIAVALGMRNGAVLAAHAQLLAAGVSHRFDRFGVFAACHARLGPAVRWKRRRTSYCCGAD